MTEKMLFFIMVFLIHIVVPVNKKAGESLNSNMGRTEMVQDASESKKKTPTQLRRERKKRQKEREKRQRELERRTLEEGEEKGGRVLAQDKNATLQSTSTSGTTSPLSSIENGASDNQRESASLSLSQSPPPPADEEIATQGKVVPQESPDPKEFGTSGAVVGVAVGVATARPEMKGEEHSPGKERSEVKKERPSGRASPTIEWDGCRKPPNLDKNYPRARNYYESYNKSLHYSSKRVKNLHEKTRQRQQLSTEMAVPKQRGTYCSLPSKADTSLAQCNGSVNVSEAPVSAHLQTESSTKPPSSYSHTNSNHYDHKQLSPYSPTSSTDNDSYSHPTGLHSDGQNLTSSTGHDLTELSCVHSKLEQSADSSQSIIMNGHEE